MGELERAVMFWYSCQYWCTEMYCNVVDKIMGVAHVGTDLRGSIPYPYRFYIARDQQLPLALLPIQDQSRILRARHMVGQSAESGD